MSTKNGGSLVLKILNTQRYTQLKAAPIFLGETRPRLTSEEGCPILSDFLKPLCCIRSSSRSAVQRQMAWGTKRN
jgi:hypothetical protein